MRLTNRERSDLEVLHRICGVTKLIRDPDDPNMLFGRTKPFAFVTVKQEDFPSISKEVMRFDIVSALSEE